MSHQSLQQELAALTRLHSEISNLKEMLITHLEQYRQNVERLHETGLSNEVYNSYMSYYRQNKQWITELIRHIEDFDVPYIRNNVAAMEYNIQVANQNAGY